MTQKEVEALREEMRRIDWYHPIDLGPDLGVTPGLCKNHDKVLKYMHIPEDLTGKRCLDIGSWDGMFAFEMERRNADKVLATDIWGRYDSPSIKHSDVGFNFARKVLNSRVVQQYASVYEIRDATMSYFDVVCFPGVLYHLREPLRALESIRSVMSEGGLLIVETHLDLLNVRRPALALYVESECGDDPTNWCGPNPEGVEALLKIAGFKKIRCVGEMNMDRNVGHGEINYARGAWHAEK